MSRVFAYSPLTEPDHIRLFLLQPAVDRNDDLVGSLQHLSLNDHYHDLIDSYTALPYVWGDPTPADTIILSGQPFGITANLGAALRDLRDATRIHRIWADALCIDQSNIPERNQQVLLMGDIYFRANSTVIYLGALTSHAEVVIQEVTRAISTGISEKSSSSSNIILDDMTEEGGILAQTWFYRVWVLQELVLSSDPWVQFGSKRIRWDDICHLLIPLLRKGRRDHFTGLENMNKIRIECWKYRHPSLSNDHHDTKMDLNCRLWSILRNRIHCGATDPRDMIFAHLGIISDKAAVLEYVKVDYAQSTTEVFTAAARYIRKYIGTLPLMRTLANFRTDSILPSWVPDWGRQISREMTEQGSEKSFPTSLTSSSRVEPFMIETATEILAVSGVLSLAPLNMSDLFSRLERTQMGFQQGGAGGYDSIGWEKFADALSDAGVDRIAVEEIASS